MVYLEDAPVAAKSLMQKIIVESNRWDGINRDNRRDMLRIQGILEEEDFRNGLLGGWTLIATILRNFMLSAQIAHIPSVEERHGFEWRIEWR